MTPFIVFLLIIIIVLTMTSYVIASFGVTVIFGAPFVRTPHLIVREMLKAVELQPGEIVMDLGSGMSDMLLVAVKEFGAKKAIGYEINPFLVWIGRWRAWRWGISDQIEIHRANFFKAKLEDADVLSLYLLSETMEKLTKKMQAELPDHARIISRGFPIPSIDPIRTVKTGRSKSHLYTIKQLHAGGIMVD
jgi:ubiquinone/menaquinone biosynthesis C-methylase UbiE